MPLLISIWFVIVAEFIGFAWLVLAYVHGTIVVSFKDGADVATLALTAATVVLAGVALVMAGLAVWGFKEIKEAAKKAGAKAGGKSGATEGRAAAERSVKLEVTSPIARLSLKVQRLSDAIGWVDNTEGDPGPYFDFPAREAADGDKK